MIRLTNYALTALMMLLGLAVLGAFASLGLVVLVTIAFVMVVGRVATWIATVFAGNHISHNLKFGR